MHVANSPLVDIDEWQDFKIAKPKEEFRCYDSAVQRVQDFYALQHKSQTLEKALEFQKQHCTNFSKGRMGIWDALSYLDTVMDESDPDTELSQTEHALQSAQAARRLRPDCDWLHLTALIHDLGKILAVTDPDRGLIGLPQWAVVGDTFPLGCAFDMRSNVYPDSFAENPDFEHPIYSTKLGIYQEHCGLDKVVMSFGHDEYLYQVLKNSCRGEGCKGSSKFSTTGGGESGLGLPLPAMACIRFHSFYPWHKQGGYQYLCNEHDAEMLPWVKIFNKADLYSKADDLVNVEEIREYYDGLICKYLPDTLEW
eukprot:CAMPEP_0113939542 /NCGR_PEP_ID=MMETSP1339-20121228/5838_1 /TAXON_ID=94617 /ORGANISM="Fibrocapsa japonica" /LENGTH=309 /DNA_ID=CAMNT_0000943073 /DNA_START=75 /DNA_END=1004 /DNA_ORIENTATION=+ /assembly_acc=CAM_ASM_000762